MKRKIGKRIEERCVSLKCIPNGVRKSCAEGLNMLVLHEILAFRIVRAMHCVVHS